MKIQKEVWIVIAAVGFLISWLIDRLAGAVVISVLNPIGFLTSTELLNRYPFTATAIIIRSLAIFISVMLAVSFFDRKYFAKAVVIFFLGLFAEFYAIQQLATGYRLTTIQWTLSIAYASAILPVGIIYMLILGIWATFNKKGTAEEKEEDLTTNEEDSSA